MVLIVIWIIVWKVSVCISFRPLAGIVVLIVTTREMYYILDALRFRPLAGIVVLIRTLYKWLYEAVEMAFCGADHIFSSFFVFLQENDFQKIVWA